MPLRRCTKFSAVRSPVSSARAGPVTNGNLVARKSAERRRHDEKAAPRSRQKSAAEARHPPESAFCRAIIRPVPLASAGTQRFDVMSPEPISSAKAEPNGFATSGFQRQAMKAVIITASMRSIGRRARLHHVFGTSSIRGARSARASRSFSSVLRLIYGHSLQLQFSLATK